MKVFTKTQGMIMVLQKLQDFEDSLPQKQFIGVHKSYIVTQGSITMLEGNRLFVGETEVPIGIMYKKVLKIVLRCRDKGLLSF